MKKSKIRKVYEPYEARCTLCNAHFSSAIDGNRHVKLAHPGFLDMLVLEEKQAVVRNRKSGKVVRKYLTDGGLSEFQGRKKKK